MLPLPDLFGSARRLWVCVECSFVLVVFLLEVEERVDDQTGGRTVKDVYGRRLQPRLEVEHGERDVLRVVLRKERREEKKRKEKKRKEKKRKERK